VEAGNAARRAGPCRRRWLNRGKRRKTVGSVGDPLGLSHCRAASAKRWRLRNCQAAATAVPMPARRLTSCLGRQVHRSGRADQRARRGSRRRVVGRGQAGWRTPAVQPGNGSGSTPSWPICSRSARSSFRSSGWRSSPPLLSAVGLSIGPPRPPMTRTSFLAIDSLASSTRMAW
jgi:hypothetical protein